ncbi:MAG: cytochrome c3 family protein, partial [Desulfobacterales bacterium]
GDVNLAVEKGAEGVGWKYSGHEFAETERYMGLFHEVAPKEQALSCNDCHNGGDRLDFAALGYTPKDTYNNKPLCASCHEDESNEWPEEYFKKVHAKHVTDKKLDCNKCHIFNKAN